MTKAVRIYDDAFQMSHRHAPRGYGSWGFVVMDGSASPPAEHSLFFAPSSRLSEAKAWAKDHVRQELAAELATGHLWLEIAP